MHQVIDTLEKAFGDKKDQYYRVWIDSLSFAEVSVGSWLVKFDKWEISGEIFLNFNSLVLSSILQLDFMIQIIDCLRDSDF